MSRHRKVKNLDFDEDYDEYYGDYDDDFDEDVAGFDEGAFEAQYLSSGINLKSNNNSSNNVGDVAKRRQILLDEMQSQQNSLDDSEKPIAAIEPSTSVFLVNNTDCLHMGEDATCQASLTDASIAQDIDDKISQPVRSANISSPKASSSAKSEPLTIDAITSDMTQIAIKYLDKHQWQLPLMEMNDGFRDRTYYKHYTDNYISSLRSKLGHFLADHQLKSDPMGYHKRSELDNYSKYSRMSDLLIDYYESLGAGFFSFATPSPDEEIVIGCRLGTKVKKPAANKPAAGKKQADTQKAARFEYKGKQAANKAAQAAPAVSSSRNKDTTVQENFTAEHLEELSQQYVQSMHIDKSNKPKAASSKAATTLTTTTTKTVAGKAAAAPPPKGSKVAGSGSAKQLSTLGEKRRELKQLKRLAAEPSERDREAFKRAAARTRRDFDELSKHSKPTVNLVVVGHVDAGKSTLVGHLLHKLGQVSSKQMHRNEVDSQRSGKGSFKFAWALDETEAERARGVTIDLAVAQFETQHRHVVLMDAPGHVDFIPAVISGAGQADAALLIVDATRGEFETGFTSGGQTREHTFLVRSLGVKSLVVVVNKMDNVDWSRDRFEDIVQQLKPFLKQAGFELESEVEFVACSGLSGANMDSRRLTRDSQRQSSHPQLEAGLEADTASLLEAIDRLKPPERLVDQPTRLVVTDSYTGMASGVFVSGRLASGRLEAKQRLLLLPPNESLDVKQVTLKAAGSGPTGSGSADGGFAGDLLTALTTGVEANKFYRGCVLSDPLYPCPVTNRFEARIVMLPGAQTILLRGSQLEVHLNECYESGQLRRLLSLLNRNTGELLQRRPRCVGRNGSALVQLRLDRLVCCELYETNRQLGRFLLRANGQTLAAGLITKLKRPKLAKRAASKLQTSCG